MTASASDESARSVRDRGDIEDLILRYQHGLDRRDWSMVGSVFSEDAKVSYSGVEASGRPAVIELLRGRVAERVRRIGGAENDKAQMHFVGNLLVDLHGDEASAESYTIIYHVHHLGGKDQLLVRGIRYLDRCVRTSDGWRIAARTHAVDFSAMVADVLWAVPQAERVSAPLV